MRGVSLPITVHSHAFTLAETLIVMGIIGIVAALTIPNVNKNTGEAEKVAKFKKLYAELSEAHDRATAVYGPVKKWGITTSTELKKRYMSRLSEFLKIQKSCGFTAGDTNCRGIIYADNYATNLTGYRDWQNLMQSDAPSIILNSGASIYFTGNDVSLSTDGIGTLLLDIDGPKKGKNAFGIDVFLLQITENGITPGGVGYSDLYGYGAGCLRSGKTCGQWIMDFGNMDYLNINHDKPYACKNNPSKELGWEADKAHSCK
ncbi:type II secretion system protein [bacterium]|nr:type II secretion system protein [bacterium]